MSNKVTVQIHTLGCRVNQYESCAISELLIKKGFSIVKKGNSDFYIVNTCAVTSESERKSRQLVRRCASKGKVIVMGCAAQINPAYADIDNVIYVCGNRNKNTVVDVISGNLPIEKANLLMLDDCPYEIMELEGKSDLFSSCRAFIKIQDGCNGKCTYCIIPKCRGSVRSRDVDSIIREATNLVSNGYRELILTGIEVSAYNKAPLQEIIKSVAEIKGVERLRLGSLSPNIITDKFLSAVASCSAFMPHIHLSLQSCCDKILALMKRPYRKKDIFDRVELIRKYIPNCIISADIIVGFPGETESDFAETMDALKELNIFHLHSFPYSERAGTPAAVMEGSIPKTERSRRNAQLIADNKSVKEDILNSMMGDIRSVLVEKIVGTTAVGHIPEFIEAHFESDDVSVGDIISIKITSHDGNVLIGNVIKGETK